VRTFQVVVLSNEPIQVASPQRLRLAFSDSPASGASPGEISARIPSVQRTTVLTSEQMLESLFVPRRYTLSEISSNGAISWCGNSPAGLGALQ